MGLIEHDFSKICRICINSNCDMNSLFSTCLNDREIKLFEFLQKLTDLKIADDDGLPTLLCSLCVDKLNETSTFIQLCINSDSMLRLQRNQKAFEDIQREIIEDTVDFMNEEATLCQEITIEKSNIFQNDLELIKSKKYECETCNSSFDDEFKYENHTKLHGTDIFKCTECTRTFTKKTFLNVHLRSHFKNDEKKFICKDCGQQFTYNYLLKQHEFKHKDIKPYPCTKCEKGCLTAESLRRHMKIHDENYARKLHKCEHCNKEFAYPSFLAAHLKTHTGEKPYLCSFCGKGFTQISGLHYHQKTHSGVKPFKCKVCQGNFTAKSVLKVHMRIHTNERPYVCHICGVAFRQSTDLRSHQRVHSGDKPALCTICGKRMSTTGQLTVHVRSHTGEKPFICKFCRKAFTTRTLLVKHERIHTDERPYSCDVCGKAFRQSGTLKSHKNTHLTNRIRKCKKNTNSNSEISHEQFLNGAIEITQNKDKITVVLPAPIPLLHNL